VHQIGILGICWKRLQVEPGLRYIRSHQRIQIGGDLHAQPLASGDAYQRAAYGNYVFGAWMRASGTPLPLALAGANEIAFIHQLSSPNQYRGRHMDSFFWSLPVPNVTNIVNGYNAHR
jgi:hypothetical protein